MNTIDNIRTLKVEDNVYTLELRKYERVSYNKKEERGGKHKFAWCLYVCAENFENAKEKPKFRLRFKTRKDALKIEGFISSMLTQGIPFGKVHLWAYESKSGWYWKKILNKDYVDDEFIPLATPSRWEVIDSKWWVFKKKLNELNETLYSVASAKMDYGDVVFEKYEKCIDVMALIELGADLFYVSENGDTAFDALVRENNIFIDYNVLRKVKR